MQLHNCPDPHVILEIGKYLAGSVGAILLSAAARALPRPEPLGSRFYLWFFGFANLLLANLDKSKQAQVLRSDHFPRHL